MHKPSGSNRDSGQQSDAAATTNSKRKCCKRDTNKHNKTITTIIATTTTTKASAAMSPKDDSECMLVDTQPSNQLATATATTTTTHSITSTAAARTIDFEAGEEGVTTTTITRTTAATCLPASVRADIETDKINNNITSAQVSTTTTTTTGAAATPKISNLIGQMFNDVSKVPANTTTTTTSTAAVSSSDTVTGVVVVAAASTHKSSDDDLLLLPLNASQCTTCKTLSVAAQCKCVRKIESSSSTTTTTTHDDDRSQVTKVKAQTPTTTTTTTLKGTQTKSKQKPPAILSTTTTMKITNKALNMPAFTSTSTATAAQPIAASIVKNKLTTAKKLKVTTTTTTALATVPAKTLTTTTTASVRNYYERPQSSYSYRKRTISTSVMPTTTNTTITTTTTTPVRVPTTTTTTTMMLMTTPTTTNTTTTTKAAANTTNTMPVKSKSTENKCKSKQPTAFSKQRELQAHSSGESITAQTAPSIARSQAKAITTTTDITTTRQTLEAYTQHWLTQLNERVRNELCVWEQKEYWPSPTTTTITTTTRATKPITTTTTHTGTLKTKTSSLAARKAKLKLDFLLKDLTLQQQQQQQQQIQKQQLTGTCSKRLQRKATPLKLSIPSQSQIQQQQQQQQHHRNCRVTPPLQTPVLLLAAEANTPPTLIAQRKADLQQRLSEAQAKPTHTGLPQLLSPTDRFPRVRQLIDKFNATATTKTTITTTKAQAKPQQVFDMIVQPAKPTPTTAEEEIQQQQQENVVSTLKPDALSGIERHSPLSDEGCTLGQSPYSSDNEDNESIRTASTTVERSVKRKERVARSASSDSALGLEVDDGMENTLGHAQTATTTPAQHGQQRRMTLTVTDLPLRPGLLPLAEPNDLPESPTPEIQQILHNLIAQTTVPSKVLLEERVVELPELPDHHQQLQQQQSQSQSQQLRQSSITSLSNSRRESAQSCLSDYPTSECGGVRYVRTPSVVVSDYSDDVMCGITLEEIEYFRAHRLRRRRSSMDTAGPEKDADTHSDVSAASSCSNLYFCGSTISALDGSECFVNGVRTNLERKTSDCSTCSASGDEDTFTIPEQPEDAGNELADLLAAQHLSSKRAKKVGLLPLTERVPTQQLEP